MNRLVLLVALATAPMTLAGPAADAAPAVKISKVYYDSPGSDSGSNTSLNAEYFVVRNTTASARSIAGWTVKDVAGHTYRFPSPFSIGAYKTITVKTGKGTNTSATRYWGRGWYVWNNTGDTATLRNAAGTVIHRCVFDSSAYDYKNC